MKKVPAAALRKALLAGNAERRNYPANFSPDKAQRAALEKNRRASEQMISKCLQSAGLDLKKFRALQLQRSTELHRMVANYKSAALRRASRLKSSSRANMLAQAKALSDLAARGNFFAYPSFSLDTPSLFWTLPNQFITGSAAAPFDSWIKFYVAILKSGKSSHKVGFYFYWINPYQDYVVVNAATSFAANGYLEADANWTFFGGNTCSISAYALFNQWVGSPTTTIPTNVLGSAYADGNILGGDTAASAISANLGLYTAPPIAVPPGGVAVFEVALQFDRWADGDGCTAIVDFNSGDFRIWCPVVVLWLLNSPAMIAPRLR